MRIVKRLVVVALVAVTGLTVAATPAHAFSGWGFTLESRWYVSNPGACIDKDLWGPLDGSKVQLWDCNDSKQQGWYLGADFGGGWREVKNAQSDSCLDVDIARWNWNGNGNGTPVQTFRCLGPNQINQHWRLEWTSSDSVKLISRQGDKCLDIDWNGRWFNGKPLQVWDCHPAPNDNQIWKHTVHAY